MNKKLPENPFKQFEDKVEKLHIDMIKATDKAFLDSINELIHRGVLKVVYVNPRLTAEINGYTYKSEIGVFPNFPEYTQRLIKENDDLKFSNDILTKECDVLESTVNKLNEELLEITNEFESLKCDYSIIQSELNQYIATFTNFKKCLKLYED